MSLSMRRTLGLRLSVWYAVVFILGTLALVALTYAMLASSLAQRDHDIIRATLREYASRYELAGLPALQRAVELEERTGSEEQLFVRVIGRAADAVFVRSPGQPASLRKRTPTFPRNREADRFASRISWSSRNFPNADTREP